jgi:hypothetical protein
VTDRAADRTTVQALSPTGRCERLQMRSAGGLGSSHIFTHAGIAARAGQTNPPDLSNAMASTRKPPVRLAGDRETTNPLHRAHRGGRTRPDIFAGLGLDHREQGEPAVTTGGTSGMPDRWTEFEEMFRSRACTRIRTATARTPCRWLAAGSTRGGSAWSSARACAAARVTHPARSPCRNGWRFRRRLGMPRAPVPGPSGSGAGWTRRA